MTNASLSPQPKLCNCGHPSTAHWADWDGIHSCEVIGCACEGFDVRRAMDNRDERGKHKREDAAMKIVEAIHREITPQIDTNYGGEILSWILHFADTVESEVRTQERDRCKQIARHVKTEMDKYGFVSARDCARDIEALIDEAVKVELQEDR